MPLLGKAEKAQLEALILEKLESYYDVNGSQSLLADGVRVVVHGAGVVVDSGEWADPLATVPVAQLFTAMCYLSAGTPAMPRESLPPLATEATSQLSAQINRLVPD